MTTQKKEKEDSKKGLYVTYKGTYYNKTISSCLPKEYEIEMQLTDNPYRRIPKSDKLLWIGRKKLLPEYFKTNVENYPNFNGIRECRVFDVQIFGNEGETKYKLKGEDLDIKSATLKELNQFTIDKDLQTDPYSFASILAAREAVLNEWENRKINEQHSLTVEEADKQKEEEQFADVADLISFNKKN